MTSQMIHRTSIVALLLTCAVGTARSQMPRTISYQGVLADASGTFLPDGNHSIALTLYTDATGGTPVYSETHPAVAVVRGTFNLIIGSQVPLPAQLGFERAYFLGVSVDGGPELQPRTPLTAAPYALYAAVAGEAKSLAPGATNLVTSVNGISGAVTLRGAGATTINRSNDTITIGSSGGGSGSGIQGVQSSTGTLSVVNPNGPVADLDIANGAITSAKIAAGAITTSKIAVGTITTDRLADGAVTDAKIAIGAVTSPKIAAGAVTTSKIADSTVTTSKIARYAITQDRIDTTVSFTIRGNAGGDLTGAYPNPTVATSAITSNKIADSTITGADVSASAALAIATLATSGNAGIGTTAGGARLTVRGSGTTAGTTTMRVSDGSGTATLTVLDDGNVGIGAPTPTSRLEVAAAGATALRISAGGAVFSSATYVPIPGSGNAGVTVAAGVTVVRIADDGANLPIGVALPAGRAGEILIVSNDDTANGALVTTLPAPTAVAVGQTRLFIHNGAGWRLVT